MGLLFGGIAAVVLIGLVTYAVVNARSTAAEQSHLQTSLNEYTPKVRSLLQRIRPSVTEMNAVPLEGQAPEGFFPEAEKWVEDLQAASDEAQGIAPASGQQETQQAFSQAVLLYADAARTFSDAALVPQDAQKEIMTRAAAQREHATALWQLGVSLLDAARSDAGLEPSLISSPAEFSPGAQPSPSPPTDDGAGGKGGNADKGDGDKDNKSGDR